MQRHCKMESISIQKQKSKPVTSCIIYSLGKELLPLVNLDNEETRRKDHDLWVSSPSHATMSSAKWHSHANAE